MTLGFIYVGPLGRLWLQPVACRGGGAAEEDAGLKIVEEENVPDKRGQKTMQGMIAQDGASLVFPTSFGYFNPHPGAGAEELTCALRTAAALDAAKHPKNVGSFFRLHRRGAQYLNGVVAGHITRAKLGFIAAKPIPQVLQHQCLHHGYALGQPGHHHDRGLHRRLGRCPSKRPKATNSLADQRRGRVHHAWTAPGDRRDRRQARQVRLRLSRKPGQAGPAKTT